MHRVVPELILENYRADRFGGEFPAVGMFLDLSGFSRMTDTLMQHGQHGAEVLAGLMHGVFDPLVRSIFEHGGRIVSFAGDGIMALYPIEKDKQRTAMLALGAAWAIQQQLTNNPNRETVYGRFSFSIKIGLTVGTVAWRILCSADGKQATYYFRGTAVDGAASAEHHAHAGEIVLTNSINELCKSDVLTRPHGSFHLFEHFVSDVPDTILCMLPTVDVESSRIFMPEDVIVHDIRGEFRQIVNLFISIPDLTDEKLEAFIDAVFELRKQYGGLLTRIDFGDKGCNMLMLWGAPIAYENDISRTLNFILDLQERMDFPITAGVTYYIAHAGYLGSEMCEDYTCYGWGVNLASRFMMNAQTGQVWVDERVARRVSQSFEIEYLGSQHFKGFAAEQKVFALHGRKTVTDVIYQGEMVGRKSELNQLVQFVEPLWRGKFAGVIGVAGDAGIGKGRLVHAFHTSSTFNEHKAFWAICQADQILRQSFNPLRRWLHRYFEFSPDQNTDDRKLIFDSKLDGLLASIPDLELARQLNRTRSILGALVDLAWDDSLYAQLDAEGRYNNTFLALVALVKAESLRQPMVLFVDDIHFLDADTNEFLIQLKRSLAAGSDSYSVAIILAYRKQGVELQLGDGLVDIEIELAGVSSADLSHLAEIVLGGPASPELIELAMSRSEGNPYFAEQIIRYLREESLLEMSREGWKQVRRGRSSVLPGDISALLVARLDQLAQEVKAVVQTASVLGREFEVHVLAQMLNPGSETEYYVSEAEKAAIWLPLREMRYIFYHALLRDAAYSMQMRARRSELHMLALGALEKIYETEKESHYAEFAYHAENGDLRTKAQEYYSLAGRISAGLYRNNQAVDYFTRALAYTPFDDLVARFDILLWRSEVYWSWGKRDKQWEDLKLMEHLAVQLKDNVRLARTMKWRANYFHVTGQYLDAVKDAELAEEYLADFEDPKLASEIKNVRASSLLRLGRLDEAMQQAESGLKLVRRLGQRLDEGRILTVMGLIALEQKDPRDAYAFLEESLRVARELKDKRLEAYATNNLAISVGAVQGDYALAESYYQQTYEVAREVGNRSQEGVALTNLGFTAGMQGKLSSAKMYHENALLVAREIGNTYQEAYTLINLSAVSGVQNDADQALNYAQKADMLVRETHDRSGEGWSQLYIGHAFMLKQNYVEARMAYQRSLGIRLELDQTSLSMEPIAGLLDAAVQLKDIPAAIQEAEKILAHLDSGGSFEGTDEPIRIYYACYRFLDEQNDPRAQHILQMAKHALDAQVSKFKDEQIRRSFIENFPWRRAISLAAAAQD